MTGRIYVGGLPTNIQRSELEDLFNQYGKIKLIELKSFKDAATFAFIQYEDPRDADDAINGRNGYTFGDVKLRVEYERIREQGGYSRGRGEGGYASRRGGGGNTRGRGGGTGYSRGGRGESRPRRSDFRVIVTGLPPSGSWQDLKDHMRKAGEICYTDVERTGDGVVEFVHRQDMEHAIRSLDLTEFCSHKGDTAVIRVFADSMTPSCDRSRSRSRSRGRYSPQYYDRGSPPPRYSSPPRYAPRYSSPPRYAPRYSSPPRYAPPRRDLPPRRFQAQYSPPPRTYR